MKETLFAKLSVLYFINASFFKFSLVFHTNLLKKTAPERVTHETPPALVLSTHSVRDWEI